jgi:hypothetical protein
MARTMNTPITQALDACLKAVDLYEIGSKGDIIRREDLRDFFEAALKAWLKAQADALKPSK